MTGEEAPRANSAGGDSSNVPAEICLPSTAYKLFCWKVRPGAAVLRGETIALVMLKPSADTAEGPTTAAAASIQRKRPTKRKRRPVAAAISTTTATTTTTAAASSSTPAGQPSGAPSALTTRALRAWTQPSTVDAAGSATAASPAAADAAGDAATTTSTTTKGGETAASSSTESKQAAAEARIPILAPIDGMIHFGRPKGAAEGVIGMIVPCAHPTVLNGLCGVCGQQAATNGVDAIPTVGSTPVSSSSSPLAPGLTLVTVSGGVTMTISKAEGQRMVQEDSVRLRKQAKLSLVLDLDHTLLHATHDVGARKFLGRSDVRTLVLPLQMEEKAAGAATLWMQHFVKLRPHVKEFLETAATMYEVMVYTAGTRQYAEQVTLLLARHLVGAPLDQADRDLLRHQIAHAEHTIEQRKQEQRAGASPAGGADTETGQKRKRVTFGESNETTDEVTDADLSRLKDELAKAERMEGRVLECRQRLFGTRIVSRTDVPDLGMDVKSITRIFPCGGTMAVAVDDREDVWANAKDNETPGEPPDNLLLVRPYHWSSFTGFADVNNQSGDDFGTEANGVADDDQQLLWTADVLRRIHEAYYDTLSDTPKPAQRTVPAIVRDLRQQLLKNTRLVLSGLVPMNHPGGVPRAKFVRHAENSGATLSSRVTPRTTHVVAERDGTDKMLTARRVPGCHIVKPAWLMECVWTWTRRDVHPHSWPAGKVSSHSSTANVVVASPVPSFDESDISPVTPAAATATANNLSDAGQTEAIESNETKDKATTMDVSNEIEEMQIEGQKDEQKDDDDSDSDDDDDLVAELESQLTREGE